MVIRLKKLIITSGNAKSTKSIIFNYVYNDGDKYEKWIITYENGKIVKDNLYGYYLKNTNKTYDIVNLYSDEKLCKQYYKHNNITIKTRPLPYCTIK